MLNLLWYIMVIFAGLSMVKTGQPTQWTVIYLLAIIVIDGRIAEQRLADFIKKFPQESYGYRQREPGS